MVAPPVQNSRGVNGNPKWLLYGATGFTGAAVAREASASGAPRPVLAGRDAYRVGAFADSLNCPWRSGRVDRVGDLEGLLDGVSLVLNAAGPFARTGVALADACLVRGIHYLDITAEAPVLAALAKRDYIARERGSLLLPAVGFDVVASDCLAAHIANRMPDASQLRIGVAGLELASRGSIRTLASLAGQPLWVCRGGELAALAPGTLRHFFDWGAGPQQAVAVTWGDVVTAPLTTGIANVEVYFEATLPLLAMTAANAVWGSWLQTPWFQGIMQSHADLYPAGPSEEQRRGRRASVVAEACNERGQSVVARLETPEAYGFSAVVALAVVRRILMQTPAFGFHTPGEVLGPDFPLEFSGVTREDLC